MLKTCIVVCLLVSVVGTTTSAADTPSNLDGAWIIDARATEEFLVSSPRPPNADKLAQWLGLASGYMALFTYEFKGNTVVASAYRGNKVLEYQRISEQGNETKYTLKDPPESQANTLSVSMLSDKNVRIIQSDSPEMGYLLWKRGQLKTEMATPDDVMAASRIWLESVQKIVSALRTPPNPSVSGKLDELLEIEVALMDATDAVCGPVVPDEVRAGIVKFKKRLSADELQRLDAIRAGSSKYKRTFEDASKVLQEAVPTSEGGHKVCLDQALKVGRMPRT